MIIKLEIPAVLRWEGAGEVIRLTLDDIDWRKAVLHVRRPKTGAEFQLPLLPGVIESPLLKEGLRARRRWSLFAA